MLIFVIFVSYAITINFLYLSFFADVLWIIQTILWILLFPIFLAFVIIALIKFVLDMRFQDLMKRNLKPRKGGGKSW